MSTGLVSSQLLTDRKNKKQFRKKCETIFFSRKSGILFEQLIRNFVLMIKMKRYELTTVFDITSCVDKMNLSSKIISTRVIFKTEIFHNLFFSIFPYLFSSIYYQPLNRLKMQHMFPLSVYVEIIKSYFLHLLELVKHSINI